MMWFVILVLVTSMISSNGLGEQHQQWLHDACRVGDINALRRLLQVPDQDIDAQDDNDETPLYVAISEHQPLIVEILCTAGADVNYQKPDGKQSILTRAIECAAQRNSLDIIRTLCNHSMDLRKPVYYSIPWSFVKGRVVHFTTRLNNLPLLQCLTRYGANMTELDEHGNCGLHMYSAGVEVVKFLIRRGCSVNQRNGMYQTPLHLHASNFDGLPKGDVLSTLLAHGAQVNAIDFLEQNALHKGLHNMMNHGVVETLVEGGIDVNHQEFEGNTPLHEAAKYFSEVVPLIRYLVHHGANVNKPDVQMYTPLLTSLHLFFPCPAIVRALIELRSNVNATNTAGQNSLLLGCLQIVTWTHYPEDMLSIVGSYLTDYIDTLMLLVALNADPNRKDNKGNTPIQAVTKAYFKSHKITQQQQQQNHHDTLRRRQRELLEFFKQLLRAGAHVDVPGPKNKSVLDYITSARGTHHNNMVQFVRDICMPLRLTCLAACMVGRHYGSGLVHAYTACLTPEICQLILLHAPTVALSKLVA